MNIIKFLVFLFIANLIPTLAEAAGDAPSSFTYQGKLYKANGVDAVQDASVDFKLQIRSPDGLCVLFEETHHRDMTASDGIFSLMAGEGINSNATSLNLDQVFENVTMKTGAGGCTYTPLAGDTRRIRFSYDNGIEVVSMPMDQSIRSVPYALSASSLQGLSKNQFIQVSAQTTQNKIDGLSGYYTQLVGLATGTATSYVKASDLPVSNGVLDLTAGGLKIPYTPASGDYAVNKNYTDSKIGGLTLDLSGLANGQTLSWNASLSKWQLKSLASADVSTALGFSPLNKAGDTLTGTLNVNSQNILNTGYITMSSGKYFGLGTFDAAAELNLVTNVLTPGGASYAGVTWYSSSTQSVKYWNGSQALSLNSNLLVASGDVNGIMSALVVSKIQGVSVSNVAPTNNQVLTYNATTSKWEAQVPASAPVSSVAGRTGAVILAQTDIAGTLDATHGGTGQTTFSNGQLLIGNASAGLTKANLTAGSGLNVTNGDGSITLALQSGTVTGQSLNWTGSAWGVSFSNISQLRGLASAPQFPTTCTSAQTMTYSVVTDTYSCANIAISSAQISGLGGAATLSVGTSAGTLAAGDDARLVNALQVSTSASGDISGPFSNLTVGKIRGVPVSSVAPLNNQVLKFNNSLNQWEASSDLTNAGTVTSLTPGVGFTTSTPITGSGTLNVNTGTAANQIVQLDAGAKLPAVDGSQLTNMPVVPFTNVVSVTSTPWTVPNGVKKVFVQVWGAGGGGGGGATVGIGGGGGGGGGYAAGFVDVSAVSTVSLALGSAGSGGSAGANGTAGGTTNFGAISASGGAAGQSGATAGALGGVTLAGPITIAGGPGHVGTSAISVLTVVNLFGLGGSGGSAGGGGGLGGNGSLGSSSAPGAGTAPGGGGGGGGSGISGAGATGASGASGRILVWY